MKKFIFHYLWQFLFLIWLLNIALMAGTVIYYPAKLIFTDILFVDLSAQFLRAMIWLSAEFTILGMVLLALGKLEKYFKLKGWYV